MDGMACQLSSDYFRATGGVYDILLEVSHQFLSSVTKLLPTVGEKAGEESLWFPTAQGMEVQQARPREGAGEAD